MKVKKVLIKAKSMEFINWIEVEKNICENCGNDWDDYVINFTGVMGFNMHEQVVKHVLVTDLEWAQFFCNACCHTQDLKFKVLEKVERYR